MYAALSDVVTCPRCGPAFGLIMLAERMADRRAYEAWLGCPNCRERYRIEGGFADLRFGAAPATGVAEDPSVEEAARLAALLGVEAGPALVLVVGAGAVNAPLLADLVEALEVVAAWSGLAGEAERVGVSRFATPAGVLPYRSASMRGVALTDDASVAWIEEAARVVMPRSRVVVANGTPEVSERLTRAGMSVLAQDARATVAQRTAF